MFKNQNIILYIIIVIVPLTSSSFFYNLHLENTAKNAQLQKANWIGSIHVQYLDQVIMETKGNMEILALSGSAFANDPLKWRDLLEKAKRTDPRFRGMYWLDKDAQVLTGTDLELVNENLSEKKYIQLSTITKKTTVSDIRESDGISSYFVICSPVLNESNQIEGFIIAQLRLDYMENVMKILTPKDSFKVITHTGENILGVNEYKSGNDWIEFPLKEVSWKLDVKLPQITETVNYLNIINLFLMGILITHFFYLACKYWILQKETNKQKALLETQKLEIVGTLAASTAHEIKNPLTGIKGLVQLLAEKHRDKEDQFYFSVIMKEISRINDIVSEFLILGTPTAYKLDTIDIRTIMKDIDPIIESEAKLYNATYKLSLPKAPILVQCTRDQLKQVILNIAKNGFESMNSSGHLSIDISSESDSATIKITDNGCGMPEDELNKVFQPFYTSKKSGTGLGLFVCSRIMLLFGGTIKLTSMFNAGTTAEIILPLSSKPLHEHREDEI